MPAAPCQPGALPRPVSCPPARWRSPSCAPTPPGQAPGDHACATLPQTAYRRSPTVCRSSWPPIRTGKTQPDPSKPRQTTPRSTITLSGIRGHGRPPLLGRLGAPRHAPGSAVPSGWSARPVWPPVSPATPAVHQGAGPFVAEQLGLLCGSVPAFHARPPAFARVG